MKGDSTQDFCTTHTCIFSWYDMYKDLNLYYMDITAERITETEERINVCASPELYLRWFCTYNIWGPLWPCRVQGHFGVIRCTCLKMSFPEMRFPKHITNSVNLSQNLSNFWIIFSMVLGYIPATGEIGTNWTWIKCGLGEISTFCEDSWEENSEVWNYSQAIWRSLLKMLLSFLPMLRKRKTPFWTFEFAKLVKNRKAHVFKKTVQVYWSGQP